MCFTVFFTYLLLQLLHVQELLYKCCFYFLNACYQKNLRSINITFIRLRTYLYRADIASSARKLYNADQSNCYG